MCIVVILIAQIRYPNAKKSVFFIFQNVREELSKYLDYINSKSLLHANGI